MKESTITKIVLIFSVAVLLFGGWWMTENVNHRTVETKVFKVDSSKLPGSRKVAIKIRKTCRSTDCKNIENPSGMDLKGDQ